MYELIDRRPAQDDSITYQAAMPCGSVMPGPAPNSGDGIPDGPGWGIEVPHPGLDNEGPGPAPNADDDIPDGSGL